MKIQIPRAALVFLLLFLSITETSSQTNEDEYVLDEKFKFKFIKANKARGSTWVFAVKNKDKAFKKVQIRMRMKSLSGEKEAFDPNKFYIVSEEMQIRMMPIDVRYNYAAGWIFVPFGYLVDFQPQDEKLKTWLEYKPEIKNTFFDYKIDGYQDICTTINFGTKRKPKVATPYLDHEDLKSCKLDVYFSLPKSLKNIKLYYGNVLIKETTLKK